MATSILALLNVPRTRTPECLAPFARFEFALKTEVAAYAELVADIPVIRYDVKRNMDRLPGFVNPERMLKRDRSTRGRLVGWLEGRIRSRAAL